jgi:hypothetical protein
MRSDDSFLSIDKIEKQLITQVNRTAISHEKIKKRKTNNFSIESTTRNCTVKVVEIS